MNIVILIYRSRNRNSKSPVTVNEGTESSLTGSTARTFGQHITSPSSPWLYVTVQSWTPGKVQGNLTGNLALNSYIKVKVPMPLQLRVQIKLTAALDKYLNNGVNLHISTVAIPCSQLSYFRFFFLILVSISIVNLSPYLKYYLLLIPRADMSNLCWSQYSYFSLHLPIDWKDLFIYVVQTKLWLQRDFQKCLTEGRWKFDERLSPPHTVVSLSVFIS